MCEIVAVEMELIFDKEHEAEEAHGPCGLLRSTVAFAKLEIVQEVKR